MNTVDPTTGIRHVRALLDAITAAGATPPTKLTALVGAYSALSAASATTSGDTLGGLIARVAGGETLTPAELDAAIADAANAERINSFRAELRRRAELPVVQKFARELLAGAADEVINALRPAFDEARDALIAARELGIDPNTDAEAFLLDATVEQRAAWASIDPHVAVLDGIAAVVAHFNHAGAFRQFELPPVETGGMLMRASAVWCCGGHDIRRAAEAFAPREDGNHRNSPWFKAAGVLRLLSVAEVRERVRAFAEAQWDMTISNVGRGRMSADGWVAEPRRNPYALTHPAEPAPVPVPDAFAAESGAGIYVLPDRGGLA